MDEKHFGRTSGIVTGLIALPILYVLSIGPVVMWLGRSGPPVDPNVQRLINTFYYPIGLAFEHTPLRAPLEWYMEKWHQPRHHHP